MSYEYNIEAQCPDCDHIDAFNSTCKYDEYEVMSDICRECGKGKGKWKILECKETKRIEGAYNRREDYDEGKELVDFIESTFRNKEE